MYAGALSKQTIFKIDFMDLARKEGRNKVEQRGKKENKILGERSVPKGGFLFVGTDFLAPNPRATSQQFQEDLILNTAR